MEDQRVANADTWGGTTTNHSQVQRVAVCSWMADSRRLGVKDEKLLLVVQGPANRDNARCPQDVR